MWRRLVTVMLTVAMSFSGGCASPERAPGRRNLAIETEMRSRRLPSTPVQTTADTQAKLFAYEPPESNSTRTLNVRFTFKANREQSVPPLERPYYVGIDSRFHRMPTPAMPLRVGRYTIQLIGPDGERLTGILDLKDEDHPLTGITTIPLLSSIDADYLSSYVLTKKEDPVMVSTEIKPFGNEQPLVIADVILGTRKSVVGVSPTEARSLETNLLNASVGEVHRWASAESRWIACPTRLHLTISPNPTYFRITPLAGGDHSLTPVFFDFRFGPGLEQYPSAGVTSVDLAWSDEQWAAVSASGVRRFQGSYVPPETGRPGRRVLLYSAVMGNRPPLEAMRTAEDNSQSPTYSEGNE